MTWEEVGFADGFEQCTEESSWWRSKRKVRNNAAIFLLDPNRQDLSRRVTDITQHGFIIGDEKLGVVRAFLFPAINRNEVAD